ncbi:uncharacterized protein LOC131853737 [Achroia grisella]|uniref:uncharacterized protein LOC131853737 n=1 Tax=Achroia grisella TaxID=688607 RepID=UPI0027D25166|nr:uncharacterized protein LOC131853737 [Achroia grisella]
MVTTVYTATLQRESLQHQKPLPPHSWSPGPRSPYTMMGGISMLITSRAVVQAVSNRLCEARGGRGSRACVLCPKKTPYRKRHLPLPPYSILLHLELKLQWTTVFLHLKINLHLSLSVTLTSKA